MAATGNDLAASAHATGPGRPTKRSPLGEHPVKDAVRSGMVCHQRPPSDGSTPCLAAADLRNHECSSRLGIRRDLLTDL